MEAPHGSHYTLFQFFKKSYVTLDMPVMNEDFVMVSVTFLIN